jgi:hypothetical protein
MECTSNKCLCWNQEKVNKDLLCILSKGNCTLIYPYTW